MTVELDPAWTPQQCYIVGCFIGYMVGVGFALAGHIAVWLVLNRKPSGLG